MHTYSLSGVETAHNKHKEKAEGKGVKAHFRMDESGLLHLDTVESVFEMEGEVKDESTWSSKCLQQWVVSIYCQACFGKSFVMEDLWILLWKVASSNSAVG